jgi:hypothetical protein
MVTVRSMSDDRDGPVISVTVRGSAMPTSSFRRTIAQASS